MLNLLWESSSTSMDGKPPIHGSVHKSRNAQAFFFFFFSFFFIPFSQEPPLFFPILILLFGQSLPVLVGNSFCIHWVCVCHPAQPPNPPPALTILWKGRSSTDIHICMYVLQTGVGVWRLWFIPETGTRIFKTSRVPRPRNISPGGVTYYYFFFLEKKICSKITPGVGGWRGETENNRPSGQ